jgi:hypothetical protein
METMPLTINPPQDAVATLEAKARMNGKGMAEYAEELLARQLKRPTLRELFADVRQNITVGDEELAAEIDAAISESRQARKAHLVE